MSRYATPSKDILKIDYFFTTFNVQDMPSCADKCQAAKNTKSTHILDFGSKHGIFWHKFA